ncbi:MAG: AI-2E family transporter [Verrucomicrobiaceae bacterium]|nr:AI-2E family transporter [Verrucomicrobiaceae bacterium]
MKNLPTAFQRATLWTAITALSITVIGALAVGLVYLSTTVLSFLQPILVPFAVAGVLAYLLEPAVQWLERRRLSRNKAVLLVFAVFTLALGGLAWWIVPKLVTQTANLAKKVPVYTVKTRDALIDFSKKIEAEYGVTLPWHAEAEKTPQTPAGPAATENATTPPKTEEEVFDFDLQAFLNGDWVRTTLPTVAKNAWSFIKAGFGGFLGVFGLMLSFIIVPLYLYYFLIESAKIKTAWSDYLPLRASAFKDELVSCLEEINGYLIAFFRGQLFVSFINGIATGIGLAVVGLDFGVLIGLALCVLGIIPYLGIAICWLPAVVIASVQGGSALVPGDPWWMLPLIVTGVFVVVQQIDGFFITPRIVGEAVGLHPMTVIASVLVWALLLGGLLGAILAVPMTASIKVLFQRYVWRARIAPQTVGGAREHEGGEPC